MLKINLGCGKRDFGSDWIHIDGGDFPHLYSKDIVDLPFEDDSIDLIYASHVFEYFDRQEGEGVLGKWRSKLKPGGMLRLAVPDFQNMARLYAFENIALSKFLGPLYGKMKMGDKTIYHKTVYDFVSLQIMLRECNFREIQRYDWHDTEHAQFDDHSQAYIPHMDKKNGTLISLNVQAVK